MATNVRNDLEETTQEFGRIARRAPFAAVGAGEAFAEFAQTVPERAVALTSGLPSRLREQFDAFAQRGERLTDDALTRTRETLDDLRGRGKQEVRKARREASDAVEPPTGTGPYESRTVDELRELAAEHNIEGRSSMTKKELIKALRAS